MTTGTFAAGVETPNNAADQDATASEDLLRFRPRNVHPLLGSPPIIEATMVMPSRLGGPALPHTPNVKRVPTLVVTNWFGMRRRMVSIKSAPEQCIGMTTSGLSASSSVTVCSI